MKGQICIFLSVFNLPLLVKNKYIFEMAGVLLYYALAWLQSLWSCSQFPFLGLPHPWPWNTRRNLTLLRSLRYVFALLTLIDPERPRAQTEVPFASRPVFPLPPPRCRGISRFLDSAGGTSPDRLEVEKQEALRIQHLQGSWRTYRPADPRRLRLALAQVFQSRCIKSPCSPRSSQKEEGAHPGEEPRPPSARRLGRLDPSPRGSAPPSRVSVRASVSSGPRCWRAQGLRGRGCASPRRGGRCRGARC